MIALGRVKRVDTRCISGRSGADSGGSSSAWDVVAGLPEGGPPFSGQLPASQEALARAAERLWARPDVPEAERRAVLDSIDAVHAERAEDLADRLMR